VQVDAFVGGADPFVVEEVAVFLSDLLLAFGFYFVFCEFDLFGFQIEYVCGLLNQEIGYAVLQPHNPKRRLRLINPHTDPIPHLPLLRRIMIPILLKHLNKPAHSERIQTSRRQIVNLPMLFGKPTNTQHKIAHVIGWHHIDYVAVFAL
jgi:hypothetical protein